MLAIPIPARCILCPPCDDMCIALHTGTSALPTYPVLVVLLLVILTTSPSRCDGCYVQNSQRASPSFCRSCTRCAMRVKLGIADALPRLPSSG
ncbi:hypothetical protein PYCCODRAFT_320876 [Trametes coccinea BRFM310]|uniref:Uncharacterized protein n=1 Tax=Trametes coccinea (strain BRFM310) TaxID=1353009 RepID=A0A1Y2IN89_TRAC3|nr:hypothetical protein PYCCODRAFT_320876 [Trametes coccinea BRFM310]